MEQHSERSGPLPGQEAQIPEPGSAGGGGEAEARDLEDAAVVAWDVDQEPEAVVWQAEAAGDALGVPGAPGRRPATGEPRVDAALARLDELDGRPVTDHRAIFDDVHRRLREVLGELDPREPGQVAAAGAERRASR